MADIIDQIVKISIQDAISGVTTVDVNTMAIVGRNGTFATRVVDVTPALKSGTSGAEGSKKITLNIGDEKFEITTSAADTVADVIDDLVLAVNDATTGSLIFTASDNTTKLTLTAKAAGYVGAEISVKSLDGNIVFGSSSVAEITAGVGSNDAYETASAKRVAEIYGEDSELYAMAMTFFSQDSQPSRVVCIPAGQSATNAELLAKVKLAAAVLDFYHIAVATNDTEFALSLLTDSATGWQAWLADAKKVAEIQVRKTVAVGLKNHGCDRVFVCAHDEIHGTSREFLNVAVVASRCAADSARGTFAHKKCNGVTPDTFTVDEYNAWIDGGINIYTKVSGEARLFMGTTADNETFIDQVIKDDWIRFNVQSRIYQLLGEANDGHGVNYDDAGIASVAASVLNVLTLAQDTDHQYVMADSASVDYKPYSYLVQNYAEDVRKRNLPLITGRYARMNSIHTVQQVSLYVTL